MKYFLDTEFIEGFHKPFLGKKRHFIDLISIGITDEDGREYYAISNEFDLKMAWKDEWIRSNVLGPIHEELCRKESVYAKTYFWELFAPFSFRSMRNLIKWHGKSNNHIMTDIIRFVKPAGEDTGLEYSDWVAKYSNTEFYAYYADYDWVVFCSLFGRMIDLPKGFSMYCRDLKQMLDEKVEVNHSKLLAMGDKVIGLGLLDEFKDSYKKHPDYPKQENEHSALDDAKWNKKLYKFISTL